MLQQCSPQDKMRIVVHPPDDLPFEIVAKYLENCRKGLPSLVRAMDAADYEFLGVYSHKMKGSGGAYGFPGLTAIGASMEDAARGRNSAALRDCVATLQSHLESVELIQP